MEPVRIKLDDVGQVSSPEPNGHQSKNGSSFFKGIS